MTAVDNTSTSGDEMEPVQKGALDFDWNAALRTGGLLAIGLLAACEASVRGPSAEISLPGIKVDSGHNSSGGFCPPGQARKGRC